MPELIYDKEELDKLETYKRNLRWFKANYSEIKASHNGQYVAIKDEKLVDSDEDPEALFKRLKEVYADLSRLVVEYVSQHKAIYVL